MDVIGPIMNYLLQHPDSTQTRSAVAKATGLSDTQVRGGMYQIARKQLLPLETISNGKLWRMGHPGNADTAETDDGTITFTLVENVGGHLIISDADGGLYLAKRIGTTSPQE